MESLEIAKSLDYVSSLFDSLGHKGLSSHVLNLAAANHPSATPILLSVVFQSVVSHLVCPSASKSPSTPYAQSTFLNNENAHRITLSSRFSGSTQESSISHHDDKSTSLIITPRDKMCFIKFYLAIWGYPPNSPFIVQSNETNESRQLLLALGWLISHCRIFSSAHTLNNVLQMNLCIHDFSKCLLDVEKRRNARENAQNQVDKALVACNGIKNAQSKAKARSDQVLMLHGRIKMSMKLLQALLSCKAKYQYDMNEIQLLHGIKNEVNGSPYSQFELNILEERKQLSRYIKALEEVQSSAKKYLEIDKYERFFWEWIKNVTEKASIDHFSNKSGKTSKTSLVSLEVVKNNRNNGTVLPKELCYSMSGVYDFLQHELEKFVPSSLEHPKQINNGQLKNHNSLSSAVDLFSTKVMKQCSGDCENGDPCSAPVYSCTGINSSKDDIDVQTSRSIKRYLAYIRQYPFIFSDPNSRETRFDKGQPSKNAKKTHVKRLEDISMMLLPHLAVVRAKNRVQIEGHLNLATIKKDIYVGGN